MAHFDLSNYETVAERLVRWWAQYPNGRIITTIHHYDASTCVFRADGFNNDDRLIATGYAEEIFGASPVNKTSFLENCETSAIGRMISNSPIGHTGERASASEMAKVNRINSAPASSGEPSPRQLGFLRSLLRGKEWDDPQQLAFIHDVLGVDDVVIETLTSAQASKLIERLKVM